MTTNTVLKALQGGVLVTVIFAIGNRLFNGHWDTLTTYIIAFVVATVVTGFLAHNKKLGFRD